MSLTRAERETGILWDEEADTALLWTTSEPIKRRMTRRHGPPTSTHGSCAEWRFPKSYVRLPAKPRVLSEAAKAKAAASLRASR
jgi:hypothetical protein